MKNILFILPLLLSTGCVSLVPEKELNMWALTNGYTATKELDTWALGHGYILAANVPKVVVPERSPLPHPEIAKLEVKDDKGNYIPITQQYLMKMIITLFGTVEKFQFLVEIYEREYLNVGGKIMPDMTLDQLKQLYLSKVNETTKPTTKPTPKTTTPAESTAGTYPSTGLSTGSYPSTGSSTGSSTEDLTIESFSVIVDAYNYFQETGKTGD